MKPQAAIAAYRAGTTGAATTAAKVAWNNVAVWAVITFVVSVAVIWISFSLGSYDNNLERSAAMAYSIAATIVATIYLVIAMIPVVGQIIVAALRPEATPEDLEALRARSRAIGDRFPLYPRLHAGTAV